MKSFIFFVVFHPFTRPYDFFSSVFGHSEMASATVADNSKFYQESDGYYRRGALEETAL